MNSSTIHSLPGGTIHDLPADFRQAILSNQKAVETWRSITPLVRNEWVCLIISAKKSATRDRRLARALDQLSRGQRRPCCWEGCPHRKIK